MISIESVMFADLGGPAHVIRHVSACQAPHTCDLLEAKVDQQSDLTSAVWVQEAHAAEEELRQNDAETGNALPHASWLKHVICTSTFTHSNVQHRHLSLLAT